MGATRIAGQQPLKTSPHSHYCWQENAAQLSFGSVFFLSVSVCESPERVIQIPLAASFLNGEKQVMAYL